MKDWQAFNADMSKLYNVDVSSLTPSYRKEQEDYFIYSGLWTELKPEHVIGQPVVMKHLDLNTCTLQDAEGVPTVPYNIEVPFPVTVSGFAGWFTVHFNGSKENPTQKRVLLSTGPEAGYTHWGQQVRYHEMAM
jgi:protein arginine N-methyltransferase 1